MKLHLLVALSLTALLLAETAAWLTTARSSLLGDAFTAAMGDDLDAIAPARPGCVVLERGTLDRIRGGRRHPEIRRFEELGGRLLIVERHESIRRREDGCVTVWLETEWSTPIAASVTLGFFGVDSNGDGLLLVNAFGRWLLVHRWTRWF